MKTQKTYHDLLQEKFIKKKQNNPAFSLRAFARVIEISPAKLSQIMNKKQGLSMKCAKNICKKLNLSEEEKNWFCNSVGALHSRSKKEREFYLEKL